MKAMKNCFSFTYQSNYDNQQLFSFQLALMSDFLCTGKILYRSYNYNHQESLRISDHTSICLVMNIH